MGKEQPKRSSQAHAQASSKQIGQASNTGEKASVKYSTKSLSSGSSGASPYVPGTTATKYDRSEPEDSFSPNSHPVPVSGYVTGELSRPASASAKNSHAITKDTPIRVTEESVLQSIPDESETCTTLEALASTLSGPGPPEKEDSDLLAVEQDGHTVPEHTSIEELNDDIGTPSMRDREQEWCSSCTQCTETTDLESRQLLVCGRVVQDIENSASNTEHSAVFTWMDYDAFESFSKSEMVVGSSSPQPQPTPPPTELEIDRRSFPMYEKPDYIPFNCSLGD